MTKLIPYPENTIKLVLRYYSSSKEEYIIATSNISPSL